MALDPIGNKLVNRAFTRIVQIAGQRKPDGLVFEDLIGCLGALAIFVKDQRSLSAIGSSGRSPLKTAPALGDVTIVLPSHY